MWLHCQAVFQGRAESFLAGGQVRRRFLLPNHRGEPGPLSTLGLGQVSTAAGDFPSEKD